MIKIFMILVIPVSIAVLIGVLYNLTQTVEHLTKDLIQRTGAKVESELDEMIKPVSDDLKLFSEFLIASQSDSTDLSKFNKIVRPIISNNVHVKTAVYGDSYGSEFMLMQLEDSSWYSRVQKMRSSKEQEVKFYNWILDSDLKLNIVKEWQDSISLGKDPRNSVWYKRALDIEMERTVGWTKPYLFSTSGNLGITAVIRYTPLSNPKNEIVVALDLILLYLVEYVNDLEISDNGRAVLYTDDGVLCYSKSDKFSCNDSINKYSLSDNSELEIPIFEMMLHEKARQDIDYNVPFSFDYQGEKWWAEVILYNRNGIHYTKIAVVVPETDLMSEMDRTKLIIILGFGLVFILVLISLNAYRQQHHANVLLNQKKIEIEAHRDKIEAQRDKIERQHMLVSDQRDQIREIHSEVTKSISYAQRIQSSALPNIKVLMDNVKDCFVLFKPRDIVSGDFYYFTRVKNKLIISVSDCTGHGIPGAFMSMLGMSMIDNIVVSNQVFDPGEILNRMRSQIIHALSQSVDGDGQRDGMDMAICVIDLDTKIMQFAGANNPVVIVSQSHKKWKEKKGVKYLADDKTGLNLYRVKADSMPISIYLKMDEFKTHEYQLEENDMVYLFSDGFVDQFGGVNNEIRNAGGKKFKIKAFQRLLLDISELTSIEQQQILDDTIKEWRGSINQIDDVTVLGFRV
ncbi:MAG: SpoIIE family protein phosphatase [Bacteroidales bacterium]|nr:SpoIIE family protein phosphatase [Bacteroidales bacterium]